MVWISDRRIPVGPTADAWKIRFSGSMRFPVQRIGTASSGRNPMLMQVDVFSAGLCIYQKINNPMEKCIRSMRNITGEREILFYMSRARSLSADSLICNIPSQGEKRKYSMLLIESGSSKYSMLPEYCNHSSFQICIEIKTEPTFTKASFLFRDSRRERFFFPR